MKPKDEVLLCSEGCGGSCPKLHFDGETVVVTDDFGGSVSLTPESWNFLVDQIERRALVRIEL